MPGIIQDDDDDDEPCAACDEPVSGRDFGCALPDDVFEQPIAERSHRNSSDFAELGERRFVRCVMPIRVGTADEFRYGVWLEVQLATFDHIIDVWNDAPRYRELSFDGTIANAVPPWNEKILGCRVTAGTRSANDRPIVVA